MAARKDNRIKGGAGDAGTERVVVSSSEARQGDIVLRTRRRRIIFATGLAVLVILVLVVRLAILT